MRVYRGDKSKDKNPAQKPTPQPAPKPQPPLRQPDSELIGLNVHRQRHGHDPLDDPEAAEDSPEIDDQIADSGGFYSQSGLYKEPPGEDDRRELGRGVAKLARSNAGKKVALAASGFLVPIAIAFGVLLFSLNAGLQTEQVARAIIGIRFSRLYGQMAVRSSHIKETYTLQMVNPDLETNDINRRRPNRRPGLIKMLTGASDKKIFRALYKNYEPIYADKWIAGRERIVGWRDRVSKEVIINYEDSRLGSKGAQTNRFQALLRGNEGDLSGRYMSRATVRLVAYQAGFKFSRFRSIMGSIRQKARGPPRIAEAAKLIPEDAVNDKSQVRRRAGFVLRVRGLFHIQDLDIEEAGKGWATRSREWVDDKASKRLDRTKVVNKLKTKDGALKVASGWLKTASIFMLLTTAFCTAYEIVGLVRQLAQLKIRQQMDTAAKVITAASQIRAGDIEHEIVNDLNHKFDGFGNSLIYQAFYENATDHDESKVAATLKYVNHHFNIKRSFGTIFKVLNAMTVGFLDVFKIAINLVPAVQFADYVLSGINRVANFFDVNINISVNAIVDKLVNTTCKIFLDSRVQIALGVVFAAVEFVLSFATAGAIAALKILLTGVLKAIIFAVAVSQFVEATSLDEVALEHLMPEAVAVSSGASSMLLSEPKSGAENFLKVDGGARAIVEGQALSEGGGLIDREIAVAQDQRHIAQHRQRYTDKGIWDNVANPRNPYSLIARVQSRLPSTTANAQPDQLRSATSWLARVPNGLIGTTKADELTNDQLAELLYPSLDRDLDENTGDFADVSSPVKVIGFTDEEASGGGVFNFIDNTRFVEEKFGDLHTKYSQCLAIGAAEFRLHQAGISKVSEEGFYQPPSSASSNSYYPSSCQDQDARRYMIYYQDCLHISDIVLTDTNSSPMFDTGCDDMLPTNIVDNLGQQGPDLNEGGQQLGREGGVTETTPMGRAWAVVGPAAETRTPTPRPIVSDLVGFVQKAAGGVTVLWEDRRWHMA